jgi:hypothetical protein
VSAAAPLLAALLRAALPGLRALDLGLPASPLLFPWLPGTLCGVADAQALPPAEAELLRRFHHPDGRPLVGFDRAADAALLAGAPAAWGDAPERLIRPAAPPPRGLPADALLLVPPDARDAGTPRARILLLLGAGEAVERHDLLVPPTRLEAIHAALRVAAETLAGAVDGRWLTRAPAISADTASVALLPEDGQTHRPLVSLPAASLVHDLPALAGPEGIDLSGAHRQVRLLLGAAPTRLRAFLRGDASGAALFGDGRRLPATVTERAAGETCLEAEPPSGSGAAVLGLAVPASARATLTRLELMP